MDEGSTGFPADKILCQGRYLRYVVACMHNCPERHHCPEFWAFFKARGITPAQYANKGGIGEDVMKRIVFDCDRCGKKDVGEPYSIFHVAGPDEGKRLEPAEFHEVALKAGGLPCPERFLGGVLGLAHDERGWEHLCSACFKKVGSLSGMILGGPAPKPAVAVESARTETARALAGEPKPAPRAPEPKPAPRVPEPKPVPRAPEPKPAPRAPEPKPAPRAAEPKPAPRVVEPRLPLKVAEPAPAPAARKRGRK